MTRGRKPNAEYIKATIDLGGLDQTQMSTTGEVRHATDGRGAPNRCTLHVLHKAVASLSSWHFKEPAMEMPTPPERIFSAQAVLCFLAASVGGLFHFECRPLARSASAGMHDYFRSRGLDRLCHPPAGHSRP